ncbi:hypothetical protein EVAR_78823_1 [Eumeta japonica]|uniref:Uncharacterized protein n=1 Tax=Eumeta variegata TaxID=151549 RepID=A0A4C1T471_EUMVA|nr:hypothetical protein EVAR_78823_1 [Eumeta japonica]
MSPRPDLAQRLRHGEINVIPPRMIPSGEARESIQALIYTETDPLQLLGQRFGRSDAIIKQELIKLSCMKPMQNGMSDISSYINKVNYCVTSIRNLKNLS